MADAKRRRSTDDVVAIDGVTREQADRLLKLLLEERAKREELEERLKELEGARMSRADATRTARIARTAKRIGMSMEQWMKHCERVGHDDPTRLTPSLLRTYRKRRAVGDAS